MTRLASKDIAVLDPYKFMAVIGKRSSTREAGRPLSPSRAAITASRRALLMPRLARVVPDLGHIVVAGTEPR